MTATAQHVRILMATRNGAAHLRAQLASLAGQNFKNWSLWASDDGSDDATKDILRDFARDRAGRNDVHLFEGPGRGAAANFFGLLDRCRGSGDAVAFCDQDDIWYPAKLRRAIVALERRPLDRPSLYAVAARPVDAGGRPLGLAPSRPSHLPLTAAFVQNRAAGHGMVLPPRTVEFVLRAGLPDDVPFHDWWLALLVRAAGGLIVADPRPALDYRQHGANALGHAGAEGGPARRIALLRDGSYGRWIAANARALADRQGHIDPRATGIARRLARSLDVLTLARHGIRRHDAAGTLALYGAATLGWLG